MIVLDPSSSFAVQIQSNRFPIPFLYKSDIQDVDLVVQFDPPRDVDTYVHRSGRTGRAGNKGVSVLLFNPGQARDIVKIERDLGHGFKFDLVGPPSTEAALKAAAHTSAIASKSIPDETAEFFTDAAASLLAEGNDPELVVARCLAAISRRSAQVQSRSLITGELGMATVEMKNINGRFVAPNDVMFTVSKLARMSRHDSDGALSFENDVGKIQANSETGTAMFDMSVEDAKKLVEFSASIDAGGNVFSLLEELEIERGHNFGRDFGGRGGRGGGRFAGRGGGGRGSGDRFNSGFRGRGDGGRGGRDNRRGDRPSYSHSGSNRRYDQDSRGGSNPGGFRGRYDANRSRPSGRGGGSGYSSGGGNSGW
jgi:ATP-dependent RNA helicase DDX21